MSGFCESPAQWRDMDADLAAILFRMLCRRNLSYKAIATCRSDDNGVIEKSSTFRRYACGRPLVYEGIEGDCRSVTIRLLNGAVTTAIPRRNRQTDGNNLISV